MSTKNLLTKFPADGLRTSRRFITSHNKDGKGVFVVDDVGDHHRVLVQGLGVGNIIYSTAENPVDMNDDKDMFYARDNEVKLNPSPLFSASSLPYPASSSANYDLLGSALDSLEFTLRTAVSSA